ncbi:uncharacterized protein PRCAT00002084001 [Priceomyces carsonii]|uniref:uncharacterized protein n=1 Tax=Priceomyces carsonii TaxID=28549 RepID=UPI002ED8B5A2|nr:unnamed protein product [Priceomyces carsonii]
MKDTLMQPTPKHNRDVLQIPPTRETINLLTKEFYKIVSNPLDHITVKPDEQNICVWYFLVNGFEETPYFRGLYLGVMIFPSDFPYSPPELQMISPSGRFKTRVPLCLTLSSFHKELWNATWSIDKILIGFVSFMNSSEKSVGTLILSEDVKIELAQKSKEWLHASCSIFKVIFPEEYGLLDLAFNSHLITYVLNEPLQSHSREKEALKRLKHYIQHSANARIALSEYPIRLQDFMLHQYFSLSSSSEDIQKLELVMPLTPQETTISDEYSEESFSSLELSD